jgi:hypothetical protein
MLRTGISKFHDVASAVAAAAAVVDGGAVAVASVAVVAVVGDVLVDLGRIRIGRTIRWGHLQPMEVC